MKYTVKLDMHELNLVLKSLMVHAEDKRAFYENSTCEILTKYAKREHDELIDLVMKIEDEAKAERRTTCA